MSETSTDDCYLIPNDEFKKSCKDMPRIAIHSKKAAVNKLKINTLHLCIPPILDLKNCAATGVVLATVIFGKPGLNRFPPAHVKRQLLRALVDLVLRLSQRAREKLSIVYV